MLFPGDHRVSLDDLVGVLAAEPGFDQREQHALGEDETEGTLEVLFHMLRVDRQPLHHAREDSENVVEHKGGVWEDDALGGRMADVPFVPEGDVLHGGDGVAAQHPGEPGDALAEFRVALVRHRTGASLAFIERLFGFPHLGLLESADLGGELLQRCADERQGGDELRVAVALNDLGRCVFDAQPERLADDLLKLWWARGVRPHRAADRTNGDRLAGGLQTLAVAPHLVHPNGELQAEGCGLSVYAVGAAGAEGVAVAHGLFFQYQRELVDIRQQEVAGVPQLQPSRRVPDVRAGQAEMDVASLLAQGFGHGAKERGHVVVRDSDVLVDLVHAERGISPDLLGRFVRDLAQFGPRFTGGYFHIQPALKLRLVAPEGGHLRPGVARDHGAGCLLWRWEGQ